MTAEQQACEEHFLIYTTQQSNGRLVVRLPRWNPINLELLSSLQSEDYMPMNTDWKEIQTLRFTTTAS
jgi:hypothetical protein